MKRLRPVIEPIEPFVFVASAMMECMTEVQMARLALAQGDADSLRGFALRTVEEGDRIQLEISRIATRKNLPLPKSLDAEHESAVRGIGEKTGSAFDSAYAEWIAVHHRHIGRLFRRGQTIKIPEISALASRVLAIVEARIKLSHLPVAVDHLLNGGGLPHPQSPGDRGQANAGTEK